MLGSYLYWITTVALVLCLLLSILRRQTQKQLTEVRRKLLEDREQREQMRLELVQLRNAKVAVDKDLSSAKKQATESSRQLAEIEEQRTQITDERDAARTQLEQARRALADEEQARSNAEKKATELEQRLAEGSSGAQAMEHQNADLAQQLATARRDVDALQKKLDAETKLRKTAESEGASAKSKTSAVESSLSAAKAQVAKAEADLAEARAQVTKLEEELAAARSSAQTSAPSGDVLAAIEADQFLNRGQKETIRMTYNQFTAKRRSA